MGHDLAVASAMADVAGLGEEWEHSGPVREQMRSSKRLTIRPPGQKWCEATRPNCTANSNVLIPILVRMRHADRQLPYLEPLKSEIRVIYNRLAITVSDIEIYTCAIELKKLASFVKRRANRLEVTKDAHVSKGIH